MSIGHLDRTSIFLIKNLYILRQFMLNLIVISSLAQLKEKVKHIFCIYLTYLCCHLSTLL